MFANTVSNKWAETQTTVTTLDLIVFEVDRVSFGIPMTKIARIISSGFLGEDYSLTQNVEILDLHDRLTGASLLNPTSIVLWIDSHQQIVAIPIDAVPLMIAVPLDRIRTLSSDVRQQSPIGIASHVAILTIEDIESTILILAD
jgi:chemotaxis signal transduction protein